MSASLREPASLTPIHTFIRTLVSTPAHPDLTLRQLDVLLTTRDAPAENRTVRALASMLNVSKPAISRAVDRLAECGLVEREVDRKDRRSVFVNHTKSGRKFLRGLDVTRGVA